MVGWCGEQLCGQGLLCRPLLSKDTSLYPKICQAIGLTKLYLLLGTNLSTLQSKVGPFSDQGLIEHQPHSYSIFTNWSF